MKYDCSPVTADAHAPKSRAIGHSPFVAAVQMNRQPDDESHRPVIDRQLRQPVRIEPIAPQRVILQ